MTTPLTQLEQIRDEIRDAGILGFGNAIDDLLPALRAALADAERFAHLVSTFRPGTFGESEVSDLESWRAAIDRAIAASKEGSA